MLRAMRRNLLPIHRYLHTHFQRERERERMLVSGFGLPWARGRIRVLVDLKVHADTRTGSGPQITKLKSSAFLS